MLMGKASIDITDKARHGRMVSLVERMLELTPLLSPRQAGGRSGPRIPGEVERVKREVESTDRAIDRLVSPTGTSYELSPLGMIYGLSPEEIAIVEGKV